MATSQGPTCTLAASPLKISTMTDVEMVDDKGSFLSSNPFNLSDFVNSSNSQNHTSSEHNYNKAFYPHELSPSRLFSVNNRAGVQNPTTATSGADNNLKLPPIFSGRIGVGPDRNNVTPVKTDPSKVVCADKAGKIRKVILVPPGEDADKFTSKALENITSALNKQAEESIAEGKTPVRETVIEITRIAASSEKYFSRENVMKYQIVNGRETSSIKSSHLAEEACKIEPIRNNITPPPPQRDIDDEASPEAPRKDASQGREGPLNDSLTNIQWLGKMTGDNVVNHRDLRVIASEKQIEKISKECGRNKRPPFSYMHLIQMAISSKPEKRMTLREIYKWIEDKFPYYQYSPNQGWKNSIRHNLSLYDIFVREKGPSVAHGGGSYWTLRSDMPIHCKSKNFKVPGSESCNSSISSETGRASPSMMSLVGQTPIIMMNPSGTGQSTSSAKPLGKKGPTPLLPKPSVQTYALIPIQGTLPLLQAPIVMPANMTFPTETLANIAPATVKTTKPAVTPTATSTPATSASRIYLKRNASPVHILNAPKKKQAKSVTRSRSLSERTNILRGSSSRSSSTLSQSHDARNFQQMDVLEHRMSPASLDSGLDLRDSTSSSDTSHSDNVNNSGLSVSSQQAVVPGLPKPKMYKHSRRKTKHQHFMYKSFTDSSEKKKGKTLNMDGSLFEAGLSDILASIEKDLASPVRNLLKTPPAKEKSMRTSTPVKDIIDSPSWISPIHGLTPLSTDENILDSGIFTPIRSEGSNNSTPFRSGYTPTSQGSGSNSKSPRLGSLRELGLPGLTPLKTPPKRGSGTSPSYKLPNQSFTELFGDIHLDSMMESVVVE